MTTIVHNQCPTLHLLFDETRHIWVTIARRRRSTGISIPVDFFQLIARIVGFHKSGHLVSRRHMSIAVAVVTHHADSVLPSVRLLVISITECLIYQYLCLFWRSYWKSSHRYVGLTLIDVAAACRLPYLFLII